MFYIMFSVGLVEGGEFDWGDVHPNCLVFALGALIGGLMLHSVISSLLVGKLVWAPVISLCKIFIPSYVCDALLWPLIARLCNNSSIQEKKMGDETDFLHLNWSSQEFQPQFKICLIHILPLNQGHGQK